MNCLDCNAELRINEMFYFGEHCLECELKSFGDWLRVIKGISNIDAETIMANQRMYSDFRQWRAAQCQKEKAPDTIKVQSSSDS